MERVYSVLIVSANPKFAEQFRATMNPVSFSPVNIVSNAAAAERLLLDKAFELVIVDTPLPDTFGDDFAADSCRKTPAAVALCVDAALYEEVFDKVCPSGVFVLKKPLSTETVEQACDWMCATGERLRTNRKKNISLNEKMEEIRLVNRAKWLLIDKFAMSESEAHRFIEKQAMNLGITKKEMAEKVISSYA